MATVPTIAEVAEVTNPTVDGQWHDLTANTYENDDIVATQLTKEEDSKEGFYISPRKFSDFPTDFIQKDVGDAPLETLEVLDNIPEADTELVTTINAEDFLVVETKETAGANRAGIWEGLFSDIPTVRSEAISIAGDTNKFEIWRDGQKLKVRIQGNISAHNRLSLFRARFYSLLRVRRLSDRLQYQLNGIVSAGVVLRVYRFSANGAIEQAHSHVEYSNVPESFFLTSDWTDIAKLTVDIDTLEAETIISVSTRAQLVYGNGESGVIYGRLLHGSRVPVENSEEVLLYGEAPDGVEGSFVVQAAVLYRKIVAPLVVGDVEYIFQARESDNAAQGLLYNGCLFEGQVIE